MIKLLFKNILFILCLFSSLSASQDQSLSENSEEWTQHEKEIIASLRTAVLASIQGANKIHLADQGYLDLPAGYIFIPEKEGREYINILGNQVGPEFIGLIMPEDNPFAWFITVSFVKSGYIRDDDAKNLKPEDLLKFIRKQTEKENIKRMKLGGIPIEIVSWIHPPTYNSENHQLIFSTLIHERVSQDNFDKTGNYSVLVLGREGIFSLKLVVYGETFDEAKNILSAVKAPYFKPGKTYADFCVDTDRVAEFGLAALIVGIGAKKVGLLAGIGVFLTKIWYFLVMAFLIVLAKSKNTIRRFLKKLQK